LRGRQPGGRGAFRLGDGVEPFVNGAGSLRAGETVEIVTPGAGGYGPPDERDPEAVERDFADGSIDRATAAAIS
jgi:N-methylhydantoinase B